MRLKKILLLVIGLAVLTAVASIGASAMAQEAGQVIKVTAKKFQYSPNQITVKKGVPVTIELTSLDRLHGFSCPGLGLRTDIEPGKVNRVEFTPQKTGTFPFHCDIFCGTGHEGMKGTIIVTE